MKERGLSEADFPGDDKVDADAVERVAAARGTKAATTARVPAGVVPLELSPSKITEIQTLKRVHEQVVPSTVAVALRVDRLEARLRREAAEHGPVSALELALYETARLLPEWPELNGFYSDGRAWAACDGRDRLRREPRPLAARAGRQGRGAAFRCATWLVPFAT